MLLFFVFFFCFFLLFLYQVGVLDKLTHQDLPEERYQGLLFFSLKMTHVDDENN